MSSLAMTDGILFLCAAWMASRVSLPIGFRLAFGILGIAALLGFLRFSGIYPIEAWHRLFTILSGSAALPLLAASVKWPQSAVTNERQFALIFLGAAGLLGVAIAGLAKLRIYDQVLGSLSMLAMLWLLIQLRDGRRILGIVMMIVGSALFVVKAKVAPWLQPGDFLHLGMAVGIVMLSPTVLPAARTAAA